MDFYDFWWILWTKIEKLRNLQRMQEDKSIHEIPRKIANYTIASVSVALEWFGTWLKHGITIKNVRVK